MKGFIRLTERDGGCELYVNPEYIVYIKDLRTDKAVKDAKEWHWTCVETTKSSHYVKETKEEIAKLIENCLSPS